MARWQIKVHPIQWDKIMSLFPIKAATISLLQGSTIEAETEDIEFMFTKEVTECPFCGSHPWREDSPA